MRIGYNSPVVLSFSLLTIALFAFGGLDFSLRTLAAQPAMSFGSPLNIAQLFLHSLGHSSWDHLLSNLIIILLIGPMLEEKYGSLAMLLSILLTSLATGLVNAAFLKTGLLGASDIVFMLIVLASFVNVREGRIPLTFILVVAVYLGNELLHLDKQDNVAHIAHLVGGLMGALVGYLFNRQSEYG
ncbi:MAG TPA: rhomboid family intramembrane serine protease [Gammaproteobacteria bacterium]|nr:rhomboid family intramembrane serine protease [Gammaproteobacteria bacterium]